MLLYNFVIDYFAVSLHRFRLNNFKKQFTTRWRYNQSHCVAQLLHLDTVANAVFKLVSAL